MLTLESTQVLLDKAERELNRATECTRLDGKSVFDLDALKRRIDSLKKHYTMLQDMGYKK